MKEFFCIIFFFGGGISIIPINGQDKEPLDERSFEIGLRADVIANANNMFNQSFNTLSLQESDKTEYYKGGIVISDIKSGNLIYRLRFDYLYYNHYTNGRMDNTNGNYDVYNISYNNTGIQITPGIGKFLPHEFLSVKFGLEIPVFFAGSAKKQKSIKHYYSNGNNDEIKIFSDYPKGGYFIGIASFIGVEYNLSRSFISSLSSLTSYKLPLVL